MSLTAKELKTFDEIVGDTRSIVASGVVQLHLASPDPKKLANRKFDPDSILNTFPNLSNSEWTFANVMGGLCLVIDRALQTVVFQIYNIDTSEIRFEYELYENIDYQQLNSRFHSFEMEDCIAGFHFSSEEVAQKFYSKVNALRPISKEVTKKKKKGGIFGGGKKAEKTKARKTKKAKKGEIQISDVQFVKHEGKPAISGYRCTYAKIAHVGIDGAGGFDLSQISPEWKKLFVEAGVRKKDLKDPKTAQAIVAAIQNQEMNLYYQAQPEYQNYTEEDLEKMYTPEHREQYENYQEELRKYEDEIAQFRKEQEELDRWQRENAALINQIQGEEGAPVAPPRQGRRSKDGVPPVAPPRKNAGFDSTTQQVDINESNEFANELKDRGKQLKHVEAVQRELPPTPERTTKTQVKQNDFASELASQKETIKRNKEKKERMTAATSAPKQPERVRKAAQPKYDQAKLDALEKGKQAVETTKRRDLLDKMEYSNEVEDEGKRFEGIIEKEEVQKTADIMRFEQEMQKATTAAERAEIEAKKLQEERDRIMQTIKELEEKKQKNEETLRKKKEMEKQKEKHKVKDKEKQEIKLPPLPTKPNLPPPPKLPPLPKLNIPLPPPPPSKPKIEMPPPSPGLKEATKKEESKKAKKPELKKPEPKKPEPPKVRAAPKKEPKLEVKEVKKPSDKTNIVPPKHAVNTAKAADNQRKPSVAPMIKPNDENTLRPPGIQMPSELMMGIMKGAQLKKVEPSKPKTVKPPPNALLEAIQSGNARNNLRKTKYNEEKPKGRLSAKLPDFKKFANNGKVEGLLMAKLAETIKNRRNEMGATDNDEEEIDDEDSDWSLED